MSARSHLAAREILPYLVGIMTVRQLADASGASIHTVRVMIRWTVLAGLVEKVGEVGGLAGKTANTYAITIAGEEWLNG